MALTAYCDFFKVTSSEVKLTDKQYKELIQQVQELENSILDLTSTEIREVLLSIVESARRAIHLYLLTGASSFIECFDLTYGKLRMYYQRSEASPNEQKVGINVASFMFGLREYAKTTASFIELGSKAADFMKQLGM